MTNQIGLKLVQKEKPLKYYGSGITVFKDRLVQNVSFEEGKDGKPEEVEIIGKYIFEGYYLILNENTIQLIETDEGMFLIGIDDDSIILNGEIDLYDLKDQLTKSRLIVNKLKGLNGIVNKKMVESSEVERIATITKERQNAIFKIIDNIGFQINTKVTFKQSIKVAQDWINLIDRIIKQIENTLEYYRDTNLESFDDEEEVFKEFIKQIEEMYYLFKNINSRLNNHITIINTLLKLYKA